jgi:hypothetical protein
VGAIAPGAEVIHLDACFNGNFVARPYQAGAYLFGRGQTAVVVANSVNVAQDVRADRHLCLLAGGARVGSWHRLRPHLESHLFGDPTFRFAAPEARDDVAGRILAARALGEAQEDRGADARLVACLREDPASAVRLEALAALARRRSAEFERSLPFAARDPSELVRRRAVCLMGDVGRAEYIEPVLRAALRDPSERVVFKAREAARKFDPAAVKSSLDEILATMPGAPTGEEREALARSFAPGSFVVGDLEKARDKSLTVEQRVRAVRTYRLYRAHPAVPGLIALARTADDPAVRRAALEALGWFVFATEREEIAAACREITADPDSPPPVRDEAAKTVRRLRAGANDPVLP